jgi:hypothetical protein
MRFLLALATVLLSHVAFAQSEPVPSAPASSDKHFNARISALGPLIGLYSLSLDMAVDSQWTIGPNINYWSFKLSSSNSTYSDFTVKSFGVGGRAHWFANGVFNSGIYIRPFVSWNKATARLTDSSGSAVEGSASGMTAGGLLGYGWFWDSFNIMLGVGYSAGLGSTEVKVKYSNGTEEKVSSKTSGLDAEFTIGYTF